MNSYVGIWIGRSESQPPPEMYKYMHWHWNNNESGVIPNNYHDDDNKYDNDGADDLGEYL